MSMIEETRARAMQETLRLIAARKEEALVQTASKVPSPDRPHKSPQMLRQQIKAVQRKKGRSWLANVQPSTWIWIYVGLLTVITVVVYL